MNECEASTIMEVLKVASAFLFVGGFAFALAVIAIMMVRFLREAD